MAGDLYLHDASLWERSTDSTTFGGWEGGTEVRTYQPDHPGRLRVTAQVTWLRSLRLGWEGQSPVFRYEVLVAWPDGHARAAETGTEQDFPLADTGLFSEALTGAWAHVLDVAEKAMT